MVQHKHSENEVRVSTFHPWAAKKPWESAWDLRFDLEWQLDTAMVFSTWNQGTKTPSK